MRRNLCLPPLLKQKQRAEHQRVIQTHPIQPQHIKKRKDPADAMEEKSIKETIQKLLELADNILSSGNGVYFYSPREKKLLKKGSFVSLFQINPKKGRNI